MGANARSQKSRPLPTIALVGRVNVGKSTLFNKIIESQKAIISDIPGTTRTNNEGIMLWRGREVRVIDTGGLTFDDGVLFEDDILKQSEKAMKMADVIVFVLDAKVGPLPQEFDLAKILRKKTHKPVLVVANKVDNKRVAANLTEPAWYKLGMGEPFPLSATNGRNVGDFLDVVFDHLPKEEDTEEDTLPAREDILQISLIGKPNVGKSSLFNKLIGEDKVIVSDMAHTTREPHDTMVEYSYEQLESRISEEDPDEIINERVTKKQIVNFIDTAGIRRKSSVKGFLERQGIHKSIESLEKSELILFVIDGSQPITSQDMQLGGLIERRSKSVIILINKWDLAEDTTDIARKAIKKKIYSYFPHLDFAEIVFVSGKTGTGVHNIFPLITRTAEARNTKIPVKALEHFLTRVTKEHRPARGKGTRHPKLMGIRQINVGPPVFEIFVKYRTSLHRSYINYLENRLREQFNFFGTPIVIKLTKMKRS